jgi:tetratricopeptide (TPR) repeat protein
MTSPALETLARAVLDGTDVDWESAEASSAAPDAEVVRQLRLVASIGRVARTRTASWGPFELREVVGQGTFATVYRAWDPRVGREVALKLLNQDTPEADAGVIDEARHLAAAEHPNVVPVYGADIHEGRVGIWMKFIQGRTLKELLADQGPFSAEEAERIGRDLGQALSAMHRRGLVHGDVKAQNVMREVGGRVVLMDFGAGRLADHASEGPRQGSPAYLAPEVVEGQPATPRSDIYSLAVLLYHLVTGEFPVTASSWDELRELHRRGARKHLGDVRPDVPAWFIEAVERGLAARPDDRPASASALLRAPASPTGTGAWTTRLTTMAAVAVVIAASGFVGWRASRPTVGEHATQRLLVMPFDVAMAEPNLAFLSRGLAQGVSRRVTMLGDLRARVPANTVAAAAREATISAEADRTVACRLSGSARRVKAACDLAGIGSKGIRFESGEHAVEDVAALEYELARRLAFAVRGPLNSREQTRLESGVTTNEAWLLYLQGRHEWSLRTEESLALSIEHFEAALRLDPGFALAHSGMADAYTLMGAYGFLSRPRAYSLAHEAATRAVQRGPELAEARFSLGQAQKNRFEWAAAETSFRRGLELAPDSSQGHHWYSIYLLQRRRFDEAIREAKTAIELDPTSLTPRTHLATLLMLGRRYRDGIAQWESCIELGANQINTFRGLSKAYLYAGDKAKALEYAEAARSRALGHAADEELKADVAFVLASTGNKAEARVLLDELLLRYRSTSESIAGSIAAIYTGLGDRESALQWLGIAVRDRDPELGYLLVDPKWDSLRDDDRFVAAMRTVGLTGP